MTGYVDFAELKANVSIEKVAQLLNIPLKAHGAQLRGCCPIHKGTDPRGFVVTPAKGLFFCFGGCGGGDMIKLVAKMRGCELNEAASFIAEGTGTVPPNRTVPGTSNSSPQPKQAEKRAGFDVERYANTLDPSHTALGPLGVSSETLKVWKAGYSGSGVNRGRLALPLVSKDGIVIGYFGRSIKDETPLLAFPNGLNPAEHIFGADRVKAGELYLVRDPIDVLRAYETGVENVVAFLTDITPQMLEQLSSLMDERRCETVSVF